MPHPTQVFTNARGHKLQLTWIEDQQVERYQPYSQVYGVVFNQSGKILVIQQEGEWKIPGGTPEGDETPEEALHRELLEEADVTIKSPVPIGVQRVDYPHNPETAKGDQFYQYRYTCLLDGMNPSTPDPATGRRYPRKFVPADTITQVVAWGETGRAMFATAIAAYRMKLGGHC